jgi:hypothetical protein
MNTYERTTKVVACQDPHRWDADDIQIYVAVIDDSPGGRRVLCPAPMTLVEVKEGEYRQPTLGLNKSEAQHLMDSLWGCGIRPRSNTSAGQLEQAEKHLEDLRVIAFHALRIKAALPPGRGERPR